jgi:hypothetical protein
VTRDAAGFRRAVAELAGLFGRCGIPVPAAQPLDDDALPALRPRRLPVCAWFERALADVPPCLAAPLPTLASVAERMCWQQNASYAGAGFLDGYGYCELAGPGGHVRDGARSLGLLLLAPHVTYPLHAHPATETYLILCGAPRWQIGAGDPVARRAGAVIRHASGVAHAMHAGPAPLLAAYCWEDHLDQPARLTGSEHHR